MKSSIMDPRSLAIRTAVLCFFVLGLIGSLGGLSPGTCCKRAVLGAALTYVLTVAAVCAVNAILTQAVINDHLRNAEKCDV
ncbi:MAG: hypothetical protein FJ280_15035 [Planctomycetes bacterium]|nr:hypothetical protein [Planctomycetota bacterium]